MIISFPLDLKKLFNLGTAYPWVRPAYCPTCHTNHVWGHGYKPTLFDGFPQPLYLKRYRCPNCGCVIIIRPNTHYSRFQASKDTIRSSLSIRLTTGKWPPWLSSHSRGRHWLISLKRKTLSIFGLDAGSSLLGVFDRLSETGITPVSRSI